MVSLSLEYVLGVIVAGLCILKQRLRQVLGMRQWQSVRVWLRLSLNTRMVTKLLMRLLTLLWILVHAVDKASVARNGSVYASRKVGNARAIDLKWLLEVWCIYKLLYFPSCIREICLCLHNPTYDFISYLVV